MTRPSPRLLMCPPDYYRIAYEINPWMDLRRSSDQVVARCQWDSLVAILAAIGASIELLTPSSQQPDLVFTANAGVVCRDLFVPARFRHPEREGETAIFRDWFAAHGYRVANLEMSGDFEGAGDALFCGETLFAGYLHRSDISSHRQLGELLECPVASLELVDPRFYHLDTCFCPLEAGLAVYYPGAFDEYGRRVLERQIDDLIAVSEREALRFACNAVVIGRQIVCNTGAAELIEKLSQRGFVAHETPLDEFLKAGGAAKCLTLRLDGEEAAPW